MAETRTILTDQRISALISKDTTNTANKKERFHQSELFGNNQPTCAEPKKELKHNKDFFLKLSNDWMIRIVKRCAGKTSGKFDIYYFSPCKKKFRSKYELLQFIRHTKAKLSIDDFPFSMLGLLQKGIITSELLNSMIRSHEESESISTPKKKTLEGPSRIGQLGTASSNNSVSGRNPDSPVHNESSNTPKKDPVLNSVYNRSSVVSDILPQNAEKKTSQISSGNVKGNLEDKNTALKHKTQQAAVNMVDQGISHPIPKQWQKLPDEKLNKPENGLQSCELIQTSVVNGFQSSHTFSSAEFSEKPNVSSSPTSMLQNQMDKCGHRVECSPQTCGKSQQKSPDMCSQVRQKVQQPKTFPLGLEFTGKKPPKETSSTVSNDLEERYTLSALQWTIPLNLDKSKSCDLKNDKPILKRFQWDDAQKKFPFDDPTHSLKTKLRSSSSKKPLESFQKTRLSLFSVLENRGYIRKKLEGPETVVEQPEGLQLFESLCTKIKMSSSQHAEEPCRKSQRGVTEEVKKNSFEELETIETLGQKGIKHPQRTSVTTNCSPQHIGTLASQTEDEDDSPSRKATKGLKRCRLKQSSSKMKNIQVRTSSRVLKYFAKQKLRFLIKSRISQKKRQLYNKKGLKMKRIGLLRKERKNQTNNNQPRNHPASLESSQTSSVVTAKKPPLISSVLQKFALALTSKDVKKFTTLDCSDKSFQKCRSSKAPEENVDNFVTPVQPELMQSESERILSPASQTEAGRRFQKEICSSTSVEGKIKLFPLKEVQPSSCKYEIQEEIIPNLTEFQESSSSANQEVTTLTAAERLKQKDIYPSYSTEKNGTSFKTLNNLQKVTKIVEIPSNEPLCGKIMTLSGLSQNEKFHEKISDSRPCVKRKRQKPVETLLQSNLGPCNKFVKMHQENSEKEKSLDSSSKPDSLGKLARESAQSESRSEVSESDINVEDLDFEIKIENAEEDLTYEYSETEFTSKATKTVLAMKSPEIDLSMRCPETDLIMQCSETDLTKKFPETELTKKCSETDITKKCYLATESSDIDVKIESLDTDPLCELTSEVLQSKSAFEDLEPDIFCVPAPPPQPSEERITSTATLKNKMNVKNNSSSHSTKSIIIKLVPKCHNSPVHSNPGSSKEVQEMFSQSDSTGSGLSTVHLKSLADALRNALTSSNSKNPQTSRPENVEDSGKLALSSFHSSKSEDLIKNSSIFSDKISAQELPEIDLKIENPETIPHCELTSDGPKSKSAFENLEPEFFCVPAQPSQGKVMNAVTVKQNMSVTNNSPSGSKKSKIIKVVPICYNAQVYSKPAGSKEVQESSPQRNEIGSALPVVHLKSIANTSRNVLNSSDSKSSQNSKPENFDNGSRQTLSLFHTPKSEELLKKSPEADCTIEGPLGELTSEVLQSQSAFEELEPDVFWVPSSPPQPSQGRVTSAAVMKHKVSVKNNSPSDSKKSKVNKLVPKCHNPPAHSKPGSSKEVQELCSQSNDTVSDSPTVHMSSLADALKNALNSIDSKSPHAVRPETVEDSGTQILSSFHISQSQDLTKISSILSDKVLPQESHVIHSKIESPETIPHGEVTREVPRSKSTFEDFDPDFFWVPAPPPQLSQERVMNVATVKHKMKNNSASDSKTSKINKFIPKCHDSPVHSKPGSSKEVQELSSQSDDTGSGLAADRLKSLADALRNALNSLDSNSPQTPKSENVEGSGTQILSLYSSKSEELMSNLSILSDKILPQESPDIDLKIESPETIPYGELTSECPKSKSAFEDLEPDVFWIPTPPPQPFHGRVTSAANVKHKTSVKNNSPSDSKKSKIIKVPSTCHNSRVGSKPGSNKELSEMSSQSDDTGFGLSIVHLKFLADALNNALNTSDSKSPQTSRPENVENSGTQTLSSLHYSKSEDLLKNSNVLSDKISLQESSDIDLKIESPETFPHGELTCEVPQSKSAFEDLEPDVFWVPSPPPQPSQGSILSASTMKRKISVQNNSPSNFKKSNMIKLVPNCNCHNSAVHSTPGSSKEVQALSSQCDDIESGLPVAKLKSLTEALRNTLNSSGSKSPQTSRPENVESSCTQTVSSFRSSKSEDLIKISSILLDKTLPNSLNTENVKDNLIHVGNENICSTCSLNDSLEEDVIFTGEGVLQESKLFCIDKHNDETRSPQHGETQLLLQFIKTQEENRAKERFEELKFKQDKLLLREREMQLRKDELELRKQERLVFMKVFEHFISKSNVSENS